MNPPSNARPRRLGPGLEGAASGLLSRGARPVGNGSEGMPRKAADDSALTATQSADPDAVSGRAGAGPKTVYRQIRRFDRPLPTHPLAHPLTFSVTPPPPPLLPSLRPSIRPSVHPFVRPSVRPSVRPTVPSSLIPIPLSHTHIPSGTLSVSWRDVGCCSFLRAYPAQARARPALSREGERERGRERARRRSFKRGYPPSLGITVP